MSDIHESKLKLTYLTNFNQNRERVELKGPIHNSYIGNHFNLHVYPNRCDYIRIEAEVKTKHDMIALAEHLLRVANSLPPLY